jgi:Zn-dependent alcohol dehydrogenase
MAAVLGGVIAGCSTIIGIDVNPARLQLAKELGATHVIDPRDFNRDSYSAALAIRSR